MSDVTVEELSHGEERLIGKFTMSSRQIPVLELIGNTPTVPLNFASEGVTLWAKCEFLNPSGSIKDRLAKHVLTDAEHRGLLSADSIILECSSGNTGIALSMVGAAMGYRVTILMSDSASIERRRIIRRLGADLILFSSAGRYQTGIEMSREMADRDSRYFLPQQFENPLNAEDHEHSTGPEIIRQVPKIIDAFVTGFGTGGTLAGVGKAIKRKYPKAKIYAMEPAESALLAGELPCCHFIEGVADGFLPPLLQKAPLDGHRKVSSSEALTMTQRLHREFGLLVGTSSGANVDATLKSRIWTKTLPKTQCFFEENLRKPTFEGGVNVVAALQVSRELGQGATISTIFCDRAERYFSTPLFEDDP